MYPVFFLKKNKWGYNKLSSDIWIGDLGAISHITSSMEGLYNKKECKIPAQFGNKSKLYATKVGKFRGVAISKDGKNTPILLNEVKYVADLH